MPFTEEIDEAIRDAYLNYKPGKVLRLSERLCLDHSVIRRRANKLSLPKIRPPRYEYKRWTGSEVRLLLLHESCNDRQLEKIFKKHGYIRSAGAIDCFRRFHHKWLASHHQDEFSHGYSTFQLSDLLGIHPSTILRWIENGFLKAHRPSCVNWRVRREHLLEFLLEHPARWDCKKADTYWLMDLIQEHMKFKVKSVKTKRNRSNDDAI